MSSKAEKLSYSIPEAHEATGIKPRTLELACRDNKIRAKKVGKNWIIPKASLLDFLGINDATSTAGAGQQGAVSNG